MSKVQLDLETLSFVAFLFIGISGFMRNIWEAKNQIVNHQEKKMKELRNSVREDIEEMKSLAKK